MDYSSSVRFRSLSLISRWLCAGLFIVSLGIAVVAQQSGVADSATDSRTPSALSPGAPAGSFPLSGFDNINLYNGHLNFALPLLRVGGRGEAGYDITLKVERNWRSVTRRYYQGPGSLSWSTPIYYPEPNTWNSIEPGWGPGVLIGRIWRDQDPDPATFNYTNTCYTITRLTFISPDGTEFELRDQQTDGRPHQGVNGEVYSRGTIFITKDGSAATFVSDQPISDIACNDTSMDIMLGFRQLRPSGYLMLKNGIRYRIVDGNVVWMRDRNGNQISVNLTNNTNNTSGTITDSLGRIITLNGNTITYKGFGGLNRAITVIYSLLSQALRADVPSTKTYKQLFIELNGASEQMVYDPQVVSAVVLPDGRSYTLRYNEYGELARVQLPTGGAIEYEHAAGMGFSSSGVDGNQIYRRVIERRVYKDGGTGSTYDSKTVYGPVGVPEPAATDVIERTYDNQNNTLAVSRHIFSGSARDSLFPGAMVWYEPFNRGREVQTEVLSTDGTQTLLQRVVNLHENYPHPGMPWDQKLLDVDRPQDPYLKETTTTLSDTNQVTRRVFVNDKYANTTDVYQYDFGIGAPGPLVRRSHTDYLSAANYTDATGAHLRNLPTQTSIYDATETERARTTFEYDNYTSETNHAPLVDRANISGFDSAFSTFYATRGNVTATTNYLLTNGSVTGSITAFVQYDIAGNAVKTVDTRGYATTLDFSDRFGASDGEARANSGSAELNGAGQYSYAFPTVVTNALGHTTYVQYDYYLGQPVDGEDANGVISSSYFNDALDRPTQIIRGVNQGVSVKSQTTFGYDDVNRVVTTTTDQTAYGDNLLKSQIVYDALGRTIESRQYEGGTNFIAVQTHYDAMGRAFKTSSPFRAGETIVWTTSAFDALGRVKSVTTPDNASVKTDYSGNRVLVADQNILDDLRRKRISETDALGRLKTVWEVTTADEYTEDVSFPNWPSVTKGYKTTYEYDVLDNLKQVSQGSQARTFAYDSLMRLVSASNPESGTVCYGAVVSGQCQNNGYDNNGNLVLKTDARGVVTNYVYDALNRLTSRSYNDGTPAVTYVYDTLPQNGKGRLTSVSSSVSIYSYSGYDAMGRALGATQTIGGQPYTMGYTYNLAGHVKTMTYPSGRGVTYNYDNAGRLADKDAQNLAFTGNLGDGTQRTYASGISYSSFGGLTQEQFGTNTPLYHKEHYNVRGQLYDVRVSTVPWSADQWNWNRGAIINYYSTADLTASNDGRANSGADNNGNVLQQDNWIPGNDQISTYSYFRQNYSYDALNRLAAVAELQNGTTSSFAQAYSYDRWGNRTIDQTNTWGAGIPKPNFGLDTATNRLIAPAGYTMNYDVAGNLTFDNYSGQGTRTYDAENKMKQAWSNNQWQTYLYDGDGHRVKRVVNGTETWQIYGIGGELLAEYAANAVPASPQKEYGYRNGELLITATVTAGSGGSAFSFTDDPLVVGTTSVKAAHLNDLRTAVNQARVHAGLSAASWAEGITAGVTTIKASHVTELRTRLDEARTALGLSTGGYTDPALANGYDIRAAHISELRSKTNEALTAGGTGGLDIRWLVSDQLGTPRMIFDQTGSLANVSRHDYLPFGEELFGGPPSNPGVGGRLTTQGYTASDGVRQKFTGYEHDDETGLDFAEARYFSSTQGRFLSPDPLIASARRQTPQSWNRYSYVIGNPLTYVDPSGEAWIRGPGGVIFFDKDIHTAKELRKAYGRGYEIIDGRQGVIKSTFPGSGFIVGNLYTFHSDGNVTNHGVYTPRTSTPRLSTQYGDEMALAIIKLYFGAALAGATGGTGAASIALGSAGVGLDFLLSEDAPDPQTAVMAAGITISPISDDWIEKGAHIKVDGVELKALPGKDGQIVFKSVFSSTPKDRVAAAIARAEAAFADPAFMKKLTSTVARSVPHLGNHSRAAARAKSGELRFLLKILRKGK